MGNFDIKYPLLGYFFGFIGSFPGEMVLALFLGFVGAFGGWIFEKFIRYADKELKRYLDKREKKKLKKKDMDKLKGFIAKILSAYGAVGLLIAAIVGTGVVSFPEWLTYLFSEEVGSLLGGALDAVVMTAGAFLALIQAIRAPFIAQKIKDGEIGAKSVEDIKAIARNPFKF